MAFFGTQRIQADRPAEGRRQTVPYLATQEMSAIGNRDYQQDAVYVTPGKVLAANRKTRIMAVVCDGMGGMADGGRASSKAIEMLQNGFSKIEHQPSVNIPEFFYRAILAIDQTIHEFPKENGRGSGTTMVACIVEDGRLYWASVGDSRIYILRGNEMRQITRDHNYWLRLQSMVAAGQITEEEALAQKKKEALISFLGIGNVQLMDISREPVELMYGDVVLLCSDGLTKTLPVEQIQRIILDDAVGEGQKAEALVGAATRMNPHNQDNTSVALVRYYEEDIKTAVGASRR